MIGDEDYLVWRYRYRIYLYRFLIFFLEDVYIWIKKNVLFLFIVFDVDFFKIM